MNIVVALTVFITGKRLTNYGSMATPDSSTIQNDHSNIIEIMLKLEWRLGCKTCIVYTRLNTQVILKFSEFN
jgi:hypothetical protein